MASPERPELPTTRLPPNGPPPQPPQQWGPPPPYPPQQWGPPPYQEQWAPPPVPSNRPPVWVWIAGGVILVLIAAFIVVMNTGDDGTDKAPVAGGPPATAAVWGGGTSPEGLVVKVTQPVAFQPPPATARDVHGRAVAFWTTVTNGSGQPIELVPLFFGPSVDENGKDVVPLSVLSPDFDIPPSITLAPGKSFSYRSALDLDKAPVKVTLEYSTQVENQPVTVSGVV